MDLTYCFSRKVDKFVAKSKDLLSFAGDILMALWDYYNLIMIIVFPR